MKRRDFIQIVAVTAAGILPVWLPEEKHDAVDRMMQVFRDLRASREGLCPDIAISRLTRTFADFRLAGCEIEELHPSEREWRRWKPPVGYSYSHRCNWHIAALTGPVPGTDDWKAIPVGGSGRKLRCIICETEDLHPRWFDHPVLLRRQFLKVSCG